PRVGPPHAQAGEEALTGKQLVAAAAAGLVGVALFPVAAHAWTPGTHVYLGESVLANLHQLPAALADLLRAFPYDYLYGNIAADTSLAKKYAPVGRHCHAWHVGQEIFDLAPTDPLRSFGLGYLSHLAADAVAHNFFVPRQLVLTSSTAALGHSYWESRFETHLGEAYAKEAKELILQDHTPSDTHLDTIISPTLLRVRTSRRLFRGMVHPTAVGGWRVAHHLILEPPRRHLADEERHQLRFSLLVAHHLLGVGPEPLGHPARYDARVGDLDHSERLGDVARLPPSLRHFGEHALGRLLAERATAHQPDELRQGAGRHAQLLLVSLRVGEDLVDDPVRPELGVRSGVDHGLVVVGHGAIAGEHVRVGHAQGILGHEALALHRGQLRELRLLLGDELLRERERRQVGVREVAVVVALLFAALRAHAVRLRVIQQGLLRDDAPALEQRDLAVALHGQRLLDVRERVDVLHLGLRAQRRLAGPPHRDVGIHAQAPLFHIAVGDPRVLEHLLQRLEVAPGFRR